MLIHYSPTPWCCDRCLRRVFLSLSRGILGLYGYGEFWNMSCRIFPKFRAISCVRHLLMKIKTRVYCNLVLFLDLEFFLLRKKFITLVWVHVRTILSIQVCTYLQVSCTFRRSPCRYLNFYPRKSSWDYKFSNFELKGLGRGYHFCT